MYFNVAVQNFIYCDYHNIIKGDRIRIFYVYPHAFSNFFSFINF